MRFLEHKFQVLRTTGQIRSHKSVMYNWSYMSDQDNACHGSDRPSVGATDRKVLRDGDLWLWLWLIVMTKHSKTSDKSITIFFQTTKYFHRYTIHIYGVIVMVANHHGAASSLQQQPSRSLHCRRGRRAAHLAYDACLEAPP